VAHEWKLHPTRPCLHPRLGQLLSPARRAAIGPYVAELAPVQDKVPGLPLSASLKKPCWSRSWGTLRRASFDLEEQRFGSPASPSVHRASLAQRPPVVFKVRRPGLERLFRLEPGVMQQVAAVIQRHPRGARARSWVRLP